MNIQKVFFASLMTGLACSFASCDKNEAPPVVPEKEKTGAFFLSVTGESAEYILLADSVEAGVLPISNNRKTLEMSGYTWVFNDDPSVAVGLIYQQGDPGVGLGYQLTADGALDELGQFQISSRYTSYGFFDRYALTSVGGKTPVDASGNPLLDANGAQRTDGVTFNFIDVAGGLSLKEKDVTTLNITGNGDQATPSGIVDLGNGEFLTGLVVSQPREPGATGGASTGVIRYPDSVWVAAFDADLNLKRIYRDDRISYSSGRFRSQYYSQIGKAGDGTVYVFSGSYETTTSHPCGALRIKSGATAFDPDYYFNIEEKTDGYHFRKVWHVTGNYFLLEFYNDLTVAVTTAATRYGVVNVEAKTFAWVSGAPDKSKILSTGLPATYEGKVYFPITEEGADPAVYVIDPATAVAVKGLTVSGAKSINAIGRLAFAK